MYPSQNFHNGLLKGDCPPVVPGEKYTGGIPQEEEFTPTQCLERVKTKFKGDGLELCAVIDLTFTNRYYNPQVRVCSTKKLAYFSVMIQ